MSCHSCDKWPQTYWLEQFQFIMLYFQKSEACRGPPCYRGLARFFSRGFQGRSISLFIFQLLEFPWIPWLMASASHLQSQQCDISLTIPPWSHLPLHLLGGDQACSETSYNAQNSPPSPRNYPAWAHVFEAGKPCTDRQFPGDCRALGSLRTTSCRAVPTGKGQQRSFPFKDVTDLPRRRV